MNRYIGADYVVRAADETLRLVIEARTSTGTSAWAAELRRNLLRHRAVPQAPYFLLALPRHFYLWKDAPVAAVVLPCFQIDTDLLLPPYLQGLSVPIDQFSGAGWEMVVGAWLDDIVGGHLHSTLSPDVQHWLIDSGLYDAIREGTVITRAMGRWVDSLLEQSPVRFDEDIVR